MIAMGTSAVSVARAGGLLPESQEIARLTVHKKSKIELLLPFEH